MAKPDHSGDYDPTIEQIEAEIRSSQFSAWDVEEFLARRHQAKIDALTSTESKWRGRWQVAKELGTLALTFIGYLTVITVGGVWLLTGQFPIVPVGP